MEPTHPTWIEIDLQALRQNIRLLQEIAHKPVMAVVKGYAYGHGPIEVSRAALAAGATWLCVSRMDEAHFLRDAGINAPLLVLATTFPDKAAEAAARDISLVCYDPHMAAEMAAVAAASGLQLKIHAKFDTGMARLGVLPEDALAFIRRIHSLPSLKLEGVMTHFASADEPKRDTTRTQAACLRDILQTLEAAGLRPPFVHAANSAAAIYTPEATFDAIRPGISIYGLQPSAEAPFPEGFKPVLSWKARLASIKELPAGHGVGYNFRYTTAARERIGICPVGYADGLRRKLNANQVLIGGVKVPVIGTVCMDQVMIQLDAVPQAQIGDEIVLNGRQGDQQIHAEGLAAAWNTTNYEVVTGLAHRIPRWSV